MKEVWVSAITRVVSLSVFAGSFFPEEMLDTKLATEDQSVGHMLRENLSSESSSAVTRLSSELLPKCYAFLPEI